ncbi:MAG: hemolysin family protein [bacterium]
MLLPVLTLLVLLALSAFFSGTETAFFSLTPGQREELKIARPAASRRVERLLAEPPRLLGTILLGNLIVNSTASAVFTLLALSLARRAGASETLYVGVGGLIITGVIIVFSEVIPKLVAARGPAAFAALAALPVTAARWLFSPLVWLLTKVSSVFTPRSGEPDALSDDELHTMVEVGKQRGVILGHEEDILASLIGLEKRTVAEVMTPRIDIIALPDDTTVRAAIERFRDAGLSRLPVYRGTVDNIVGTAYAKEILAAPDPDAPVCGLCRPAFFVPEVKRLLELLDELRRKGSHIAIVVDEFGQTAGLVTLEDLLEAVFGEITDEYDIAEELPYTRLDDNSWLVDGEIDLAALNRLLRNAFRGTGHERLAAFIHDRLGRLPRPGDRLTYRNIEIEVRETAGNKLEKVLLHRQSRA